MENSERPDEVKAQAKEALWEAVVRELDALLAEPVPDNFLIELAFWRANYRIATKNTSGKASANAAKSNATKKARIAVAHVYIERAITECNNRKVRITKEAIEKELADLNRPEIFSDEKFQQKKAIVKPGTIIAFLANWRRKTAKC